MKKRGWLREFARDIISIGGVPFLAFVFARVLLLGKPLYFSQFVFAILIFIPFIFWFEANRNAGLALIIVIFTNLYYLLNMDYIVFSILMYVVILISLIYLKKDKKRIFNGFLFGALCSILSYYIVQSVFVIFNLT